MIDNIYSFYILSRKKKENSQFFSFYAKVFFVGFDKAFFVGSYLGPGEWHPVSDLSFSSIQDFLGLLSNLAEGDYFLVNYNDFSRI